MTVIKVATQEDIQTFLNSIASYEYIRRDGCLVLEPFCIYLAESFYLDGLTDVAPNPNDVYQLLIEIMQGTIGDIETNKSIRREAVKDWDESLRNMFPDKMMTCISIKGLIHVSHTWIYEIGHSLMALPEPAKDAKYFHWVDENWAVIHAFINGYHNSLHSFLKEIDKQGILQTGYSTYEALHLANTMEYSFEDATSVLKSRQSAYQAALNKIEKAIKDRYFLEAIVLVENLISNCIFNYLYNENKEFQNNSFNSLLIFILEKCPELGDNELRLFKEVNAWRKKRNAAVHGFISTNSNNIIQSLESFENASEITADRGKDYCKLIISWYESKSVNFIKHEFPANRIVN
jgi:hypothetical protein